MARDDSETVAIDRSSGDTLWTMKSTRLRQVAPSGSVAAISIADGTVVILDLVSWEDQVLDFGFGRIRGLAFSPDANLLAVGDESNLHIVDLSDDVLVQSIPIPFVSDVYWVADTTITFGTRDGIWATLSLETADLVEANRASLRRTFTNQECRTYRIEPCPTL